MLMVTEKWSLFFVIIIMNLFILSVSQDIMFPTCDDSATFITNDTYQRNLDGALLSVTSDTSITYNFYNKSVGQTPDQVNVIGICRGDMVPNDCRRCLNDSGPKLRLICPNQKGALGWYEDKCMLKYSSVTILGNLDMSVNSFLVNPNNMSKADQFMVDKLLERLKNETSSGGSSRKYASGDINNTRRTNFYGLMQCTPDLSKDQCDSCLDAAIGQLPFCCDSKRGARIFYPSCIIQYEDNKFFKDAVVLAPLPSTPPTQSLTPPSPSLSPPRGKSSKTTTIIVVTIATICLIIALVVIFVCMFIRRKRNRPLKNSDIDEIGTLESLQYSYNIIKAATNNFSNDNKLGEGGFGMVYKGKLESGQEIAVKRLSSDSRQGEREFKNEILLLARLQHRNLVRLLGFSLEGSERLLMYEFVQNASLDKYIFDPTTHATLDWEKRYKILEGVARGLMYLHEDSRLKIIHRDLKASNVLLDAEMNPKIADFGMARLFTPEETQHNTSRIVGTYGYMAPEYAMHGEFSVKSDVFSFGVLILEIITGHKNHSFQNGEVIEDLLSHAWKSWRDGVTSNLIDETLMDGSDSLQNMIRCMQIGLLCVQENITDRPTMSSVVVMLSSFSLTLAIPSEPAFFMHESSVSSHSKTESKSTQGSAISDTSMNDLYPQ